MRPVQLMKNRIEELEAGDLSSKIDIIGEDELADLSISMNQLIKDISNILDDRIIISFRSFSKSLNNVVYPFICSTGT